MGGNYLQLHGSQQYVCWRFADVMEDCIRTARDIDPAVQSIVDALQEERSALEAMRRRPHTAEERAEHVPIQAR